MGSETHMEEYQVDWGLTVTVLQEGYKSVPIIRYVSEILLKFIWWLWNTGMYFVIEWKCKLIFCLFYWNCRFFFVITVHLQWLHFAIQILVFQKIPQLYEWRTLPDTFRVHQYIFNQLQVMILYIVTICKKVWTWYWHTDWHRPTTCTPTLHAVL